LDRFGNARVLVVAGSDSGGGAGIQADLKTIMALGGHASTAITALTAQNTLGVQGVHPVPVDFVREQMRVVLEDIGADCVKTGMLQDRAVIDAVVAELKARAPGLDMVVDPVMVAKSGDQLISDDAVSHLRSVLLPQAKVLTPNLPEAEVLLGQPIRGLEAMREAAMALRALGPEHVLLKGGHQQGEMISDCLASADGVEVFTSIRLDTRCNNGTGCTLASAVAAGLAHELTVREAVVQARKYLFEALRSARRLGEGAGPVNHGFNVKCP
jgi:hydroxymethylpyrimidine/phosphomethylpyrimidine kinase